MKFTDSEIEKAKELKRLKLQDRIENFSMGAGRYFWARENWAKENSNSSIQIQSQIFLAVENLEVGPHFIWMPTFDDLLEIAPQLQITFSQITDYLHRRRFADGREREGLYQLLIEKLR